jgi:hypothetical protein
MKKFINNEDAVSLERLVAIRNPLMHFRDLNDSENLLRRAMTSDRSELELLESDAIFAIGVAIKILSKQPFRLGR